MAVDPKGGTLYIANEDDSMVTVMDAKSGDVTAEIPVGVEPEGMGVSPDSQYTVATSESTSMAHVIDNATRKLVANMLVDTRPREAKFTPDGKEVWVSSEVGGSISVSSQSDIAPSSRLIALSLCRLAWLSLAITVSSLEEPRRREQVVLLLRDRQPPR